MKDKLSSFSLYYLWAFKSAWNWVVSSCCCWVGEVQHQVMNLSSARVHHLAKLWSSLVETRLQATLKRGTGGDRNQPVGAYPSCSSKARELPSLEHRAGVFIARYWTFHFYSGTTGLFSAWPLTPTKDWGCARLECLRTSNAPLFDMCLADEGAFPPTSCLAFSTTSHPQVLWGWYSAHLRYCFPF